MLSMCLFSDASREALARLRQTGLPAPHQRPSYLLDDRFDEGSGTLGQVEVKPRDAGEAPRGFSRITIAAQSLPCPFSFFSHFTKITLFQAATMTAWPSSKRRKSATRRHRRRETRSYFSPLLRCLRLPRPPPRHATKAKGQRRLPASLLLSVLCCELGCCDRGPGVPVEPAGDLTSSCGPWPPYELSDCDGGLCKGRMVSKE